MAMIESHKTANKVECRCLIVTGHSSLNLRLISTALSASVWQSCSCGRRHAHGLMGCTENGSEEAELTPLTDVIEAYERGWPSGRIPGGQGLIGR